MCVYQCVYVYIRLCMSVHICCVHAHVCYMCVYVHVMYLCLFCVLCILSIKYINIITIYRTFKVEMPLTK